MRIAILFGSKCDAIGIKITKKKLWLFKVKDFKGSTFVALVQLCRLQIKGKRIRKF